jgi:hypothetical protein
MPCRLMSSLTLWKPRSKSRAVRNQLKTPAGGQPTRQLLDMQWERHLTAIASLRPTAGMSFGHMCSSVVHEPQRDWFHAVALLLLSTRCSLPSPPPDRCMHCLQPLDHRPALPPMLMTPSSIRR